jgi:hypothetical protein
VIVFYYLISPLKEHYDVILSAIVSAHREIILPQIITPEDVIQPFQLSHSILLPDLFLPSTDRAP